MARRRKHKPSLPPRKDAAPAPAKAPPAEPPAKATETAVRRRILPRPLQALDADYSALLTMRNVRWMIVILAVLGALFLGWYLSGIFVPLLVALAVAYILNPLVGWLQRKGLSRTRAVLFIFLAFLALSAATGVWFVTSIVKDVKEIGGQLGELVVDIQENQDEWVAGWNDSVPGWVRADPEQVNLDAVLEVVRDRVAPRSVEMASAEEKQAIASMAGARADYLASFQALDQNRDLALTEGELAASAVSIMDADQDARVDTSEWFAHFGAAELPGASERTLAPEARSAAEGLFDFVSSGLVTLLELLLFLTLVPIYTWYFMVGLDRIKERLEGYLPGKHRPRILRILKEIDGMAKAFFRGRLIVVLIMTVANTVLFLALGVPYAFLLGLLAGLGVLIPYFAIVAGWLPALALMAVDPTAGVGLIVVMSVVFFALQAVEQYFLTPKLLGDAVELHPVTLLVGVFVMAALFGIFGALLAVPLTAIAKTLGREFLLPYFRSLAQEEPEEAKA